MLEQNLNRYWETVIDTIHEGLMIVDTSGTIISVNRGLSAMTGFSPEELVGEPCSALGCDICQMARDCEHAQWCVLFGTGNLEFRRCTLARKNGERVHVLKNAALLRDEDGKVVGAVETMTDISEIIEKNHQIDAFKRELRGEDGFHGILGISERMHQVFDLVENAAHSDAPVIIFGESGTGKELVAQAIHDAGARKRSPYVKVNCAALNESLLESELFGHVKGAFTGAYRSRQGRFEAARGGDIFLDEIGDLPPSIQVKLLRVLEENVIERVGDNRPIPVDVRIITATNRDLRGLVKEGAFREDLFFRINVIPIVLPPLRERLEDIPILAEAFFRRIKLKNAKPIRGISEDAMAILVNYSWPGNVRELRSAFEYAFVACRETLIQPYHFPPQVLEGSPSPERRKRRVVIDRDTLKRRELIKALKTAGGNQSEAARILGVSRVTVWNRMKKYGIDVRHSVSG
ncbi:MAG: sigma-54-dependent Fis family transcriptional regulator [Deltaproteobacteria bacterium]|nr:MAG: sigma-54-dependent Fis family transcriptional regulator [Deltaproteobacteria bacterium]